MAQVRRTGEALVTSELDLASASACSGTFATFVVLAELQLVTTSTLVT